MRIGWYSNAPDTPTGYGNQTRQIVTRMRDAGHEVHVLANFGQIVGVRDYDGVAVWPQGAASYSLDVVDDWARTVQPDVIFTLYDVWVLRDAFKGYRTLSWTPVDHFPIPPDVLKWAKKHRTIAMSEYGRKLFGQEGVDALAIPHGVEEVFTPTPSDVRERMKVPESAFLVTINAANIGVTPPRKGWSQNLQAMAAFMARHDDVYLYIHSDLLRPNGMPLPILVQALGMDPSRLRKVDQYLYRAGLVPDEELARIYTASDVLLAASKGEGFGIPVLESMACGTPAIVSDFSAQPEIVGDTGWKVPVELDWDHNQGAFFCNPLIGGIVDALEDAYQRRGEDNSAVLEQAAKYRIDKLWQERWLPLLAELAEPEEKPKRNRKQRRRKNR